MIPVPHDDSMERLSHELQAAGVVCSGVGSSGVITDLQPGHEPLAALVLAAKNKDLASPQCLAVRDALGAASPEWAAYQAVRQGIVKKRRKEQFLTEAIDLLADLYDGCEEEEKGNGKKAVIFDGVKLKAFKDKIADIKSCNPLAAAAMRKE